MSEQNDMWDRFFVGSKYEAKWLKLGQRAPDAVIDGAEEFASWIDRLKVQRQDDPPRAMACNPFGTTSSRQDAA